MWCFMPRPSTRKIVARWIQPMGKGSLWRAPPLLTEIPMEGASAHRSPTTPSPALVNSL